MISFPINQRREGWRPIFGIKIYLLSCSLVFSLFLLAPPPQPQYKSAQKTMWALAVITVSFECWLHTRHGHYKNCLCGTLHFSQDIIKYTYVVSILWPVSYSFAQTFWVIPPNNMTPDFVQTDSTTYRLQSLAYVSSEIRLKGRCYLYPEQPKTVSGWL